MKIVEPSYEIISCPDGEACLAKLERICRLAYKSEDKIDDGRERCGRCGGRGRDYGENLVHGVVCKTCSGKGWVQAREPSSHKLLRTILKTNRRKQLVDKLMVEAFGEADDSWQGLMLEEPEEAQRFLREVVDFVMDDLRDDPPHESVIEHESITVLLTSNRGFTHELVRHRIGVAYTQESTRYCNYAKGKFGSSITVTGRTEEEMEKSARALDDWLHGLKALEKVYMSLVEEGVKPQIARDVLPQVLKAEIVCTANLRAWRHIFRLRCSPRAHPDMRGLMIPLRDEFRARIPIIFDEA
jgi:flavin-dependent thymidylate synthase